MEKTYSYDQKKISLKEMWNNLYPEYIEQYLPILISVFILIITTVIICKFFFRQSTRCCVLLMGLCESGKTLLFSQLCHGKEVVTVTSIKESTYNYIIGKKSLQICDLPGHERIRYTMFDKFKANVRGIAFVVDSSTIQKDIRDVTEFVYTVLCDACIQSNRIPLLIVCNKQDLPLAKGALPVRKTMEKEMNLLRMTRVNQLKSVGGEKENNNSPFLGKRGKDFDFDDVGVEVQFVETSVKGNIQLDDVQQWLNQL